MGVGTAKQEMFHWKVFYIKDGPSEYIGSVDAPDQKTATELAAVQYAVSEDKRQWLFAGRVHPDGGGFMFGGDLFGGW